MSKQRKLILVLALITVFVAMAIFFQSMGVKSSLVMAQEICEGDFDTDGDVDGSDLAAFAADFGRTDCPSNPPAVVSKTGQSASHASGDDGDLEKGAAWPVPRFTDNGDGTVTDNLTGLIWLEEANCFGQEKWLDALNDCASLADGSCGLTDGSSGGDWRVPNIKELLSLIHYGVSLPVLPNTAGTGKWSEGDPFTGVQSYYWSSTTDANDVGLAWLVLFYFGDLYHHGKNSQYYVWCVRSGQ
jgi:hypothetical protein